MQIHRADNRYCFSVTEVFQDGRVLVFTYVHVGEQITALMDVYDDATLQGGRRYLNFRQPQNMEIPQLSE